ncbi:ABC transporter substrate-binding protein [Paenibacillus glycanilyticus]|uniref:ABC transporter substrate-binding protein n=2 Tax=Paenibacillus glycanilyticus TaxID=126569 RepID=A0ABQ6GF14_9BACL|nr:ABC transporter substrate-binding protein [Paenibacillus glycanilyticus]
MFRSIFGHMVTALAGILLLTACTNTGGTAKNAGEAGTGNAPLPIRVFAQQEMGLDLETNTFTKLLEEKFGVKFNWDLVSGEGAKEQRQISLAGGDYPDAYWLTTYIDQFSQADLMKYGKQGVIIPLNKLIEQYAPNMKAAMEREPALKALQTAPDGNIYGLAAYSDCFHCSYPNKMWVNAKWLKQLNLELPATTEQFKHMLEAFKHGDPNGNNLQDEVPLSGSTENFGVHIIPYLMNGFIYHDDRTFLGITDGKLYSVVDKPEWKEGLAYIKSLYDEGLIDPGAFTQNSEALRKVGENADAEILGAAAAMHPDIFVYGERSADYEPLPPLAGPHAAYASFVGGGLSPGAKFVITSKATEEEQIALIRMVDYIYTPDGQTVAQSGLEGTGWRKPEAGEIALGEGVQPKYAAIPNEAGTYGQNSGWSGMAHFYMPREYRDSWVAAKDIFANTGYERRLYEATLLYEGHEPDEVFPYWAVWMAPEEADEAAMLQTNLKNYIEQSTLQFITGNLDLDKDWDEYVEGLNQLQISRYVELMQQAYNDYKE